MTGAAARWCGPPPPPSIWSLSLLSQLPRWSEPPSPIHSRCKHMVIERALEKLKQANAASSAGQGAGAAVKSTVRKTPAPAEVASGPRPVFPRVAVDPQAIELYRVVLPDVYAADDPRAGAAYRMLRTRLLHKLRSN